MGCVRSILLLILFLCCSACGSGPVEPSLPPGSVEAGEWWGFVQINYTNPITGQPAINNCNHEWTLLPNNTGVFSGTFRNTGGTGAFQAAECVESGTFSGSLSPTGLVSGLRFSVALGRKVVDRECTSVSPPTFSGETSGSWLEARGTDTIQCYVTNDGLPTLITRTLLVHVQKRQ